VYNATKITLGVIAMYTVGAFNIIRQNQSVLLIKRQDMPFWDLPGGRRKIGESTVECLQRETFEETGLHVRTENKVGNFINYERQDKQIVYCGSIVSGKLISQGPETKKVQFFPINKLPINLIPHRKHQIELAFADAPTVDEEIHDSKITMWVRGLVG